MYSENGLVANWILWITGVVCAYIFSIIVRNGDMPARFVFPWKRAELMRFVKWCKED